MNDAANYFGVFLMLPLALHAEPPSQLCVRVAEIDIDPQQIVQYKAALKQEIEASIRLEPGMLSLQSVARKDDPCHVTLMETYASQAEYEAHLKSVRFLQYKAVTGGMIRGLSFRGRCRSCWGRRLLRLSTGSLWARSRIRLAPRCVEASRATAAKDSEA